MTANREQAEATEFFYWAHHADDLTAYLLSSPNRHTRRLYAADLESFRRWLTRRGYPAESLPLTLAIWFSHGLDHARELVEGYRDQLLAAGKSTGTVNRHLCTFRAVARIARRLGRIDWDLACVGNVRDNVLPVSGGAGLRASELRHAS